MKADEKTKLGKKPSLKKKIASEMKEYLINFAYLALFFSIFTWYRRLVLAQYGIGYFNYGASLIEALIIAKVVMIGDFLKLGQRFLGDKPLIFITVYKSVIFTILVGLFSFIEYAIRGLFGGKGIAGGIQDLLAKDFNEMLARNLIIFCAFIPFFAFKELERISEKNKIRQLFFHKKEI